MKEVIIKFEPFVFKQTVFIKDEKGEITQEHIPQKELGSFISLLNDVKTVHFFGNEKFAEKVKTECVTQYKLKDLEILINK